MSQNEPQRKSRIDPSVIAAIIGGICTIAATIITLAVNNANNNNQAAVITVAASAAAVQATDTAVSLMTVSPVSTATLVLSATLLPADTIVPAPTNTLLPTDVPTTAVPTTAPTDVPPSTPTVMSGPTTVPAGWLLVQFAYGSKGFFWVNVADTKFAANRISFAALDGTSGFQGSRWAQYGRDIYPGGCMRLNAENEVAYATAPDACIQMNATVVSSSQEMFWMQPFRVLWDGVEIAQCTGGEGTCDAALPN